ncbi:LacI family DNA-binding transcriptional regulator [Pseudoduganella eburnea]|uniref:LacI family DNA-binding transcriptional regulator n=1 Tax=Massilia eburnea TaxID=1776165 RepID=A0A6L6QF31_9BURK|nr:LacI family DNA-binding transcriptional regulator [Massilia eburnea]MTW11098.1 LacI family DNA-binding transcriptional regulator [Massilia eburnea]
MKKAGVTLVDVAKLAGVSVMTASRALSGEGYASEETRTKVQAAAKQLGYTPNALARMMKGGKTNVIGVVVNDLTSSVINCFVTALSEEVRKVDMDLFIYNSLGDLGDGKGKRVSQMLHGLWDGLVYVLPRMTDDYLETLEKSSSPIVLINYFRHETSLPVVRGDNVNGAHDAVSHLVELGHRRIGFIRGNAYTGQSDLREQGYVKALSDAGIELDPALVYQGNFSEQSGMDGGHHLLSLAEPPTAIFAASDAMAQGAMTAIREKGLRIPEDISVIGFDDIPSAAMTRPPLTTLRHPFDAMAHATVQELVRRIKGEPGRRHRIEFPSEFVVRESTGPAPAGSSSKRSRLRRV